MQNTATEEPLAAESKQSYRHFHNFNLEYLKEMVQENTISLELTEQLLQYWQKRLSDADDPIYSNFFEYYLFFESLQCGILSATLLHTFDYHVVHQYGILNAAMEKVVKRITQVSQEHKDEGKEFQLKEKFIFEDNFFNLWMRSFVFQSHEYVLAVLYPTHISIDKPLARIQDMFYRFYLPDTIGQDIRFLPVFEKYSRHITELCHASFQKQNTREQKNVTFAFLRFKDYKKYLEHIGENYSKLILNDLQDFLEAKLDKTKGDLLVTFSTQEFLLVFFEQEYENVKAIFQHLPIRVKNMLLPYKIKVSSFNAPFHSFTSVWQEIKL